MKVNSPFGICRLLARLQRDIEVGKMREPLGPPRDHLMQVGGLDERPQSRGDFADATASAARATLSAELSCTRPMRMPAALKTIERDVGVLEFHREMAAIETDADVLADGIARRGGADAKPGRRARRRRAWNSHRSKNSIVSVVFSSRQSGSGSMSRCSNWPLAW